MLVALCFGVTAIALLLLAPVALTTGQWQVRRPKLALAGWFGSFFIGALCAGAMVVSLVVAAVTTTASTSLTKAVATAVFSWLALAVAGAIIALVFAFTEPLNASQRATLRKMAPTAVSREKRDEFTFVRFEVAEPVACAVPGRLPQILVSTGLEDLLSAPQLQAVLAHEYAHLRHRHGWVVRIAELNACACRASSPPDTVSSRRPCCWWNWPPTTPRPSRPGPSIWPTPSGTCPRRPGMRECSCGLNG
ncbi:M56 family metallopeptidase [Arthrobacter sp. JCM 19049]|uniref:M56 family metallopeptidase n=1 Tax=Arthrobacter sp. JCM 19049 TaxID=1460643 RepID=UPI0006D0787C|nr:M56 family metallopeptidase [Arthrobacter sp. JCM 19049]